MNENDIKGRKKLINAIKKRNEQKNIYIYIVERKKEICKDLRWKKEMKIFQERKRGECYASH